MEMKKINSGRLRAIGYEARTRRQEPARRVIPEIMRIPEALIIRDSQCCSLNRSR